jgi:ABC-type sugar transport system, periplasmic component
MVIAEQQNADWNRQKARDLAQIWINKHDDLAAIFCNNDTMALGVQEAVNASGRDILVVGVDGIGEAYDSIRRGEMDATVDSFPFYKGQIAVELALRVLGGQDLPRVVWTPQALIDSSNVDAEAAQIISWSDPEFK